MNLVFLHPNDLSQFNELLTSVAYEAIWKADASRIKSKFKELTALEFTQREIKVLIHDGQSMSGTVTSPMLLSLKNLSISKKRIALLHELGHRLLSGNNLYSSGDDAEYLQEEEKRLYLFLGDALHDLYGQETYLEWASADPDKYTDEHLIPLAYALGFTKVERRNKLKKLVTNNSIE